MFWGFFPLWEHFHDPSENIDKYKLQTIEGWYFKMTLPIFFFTCPFSFYFFILDWVAFNSEINMLKTQNNVSISILVQGKQGIFLSSSYRILLTCTFAFQNWFSEIFMAKLLCLFKIQQLLRKLFKAIKTWLIYMVVYLTKLTIMS